MDMDAGDVISRRSNAANTLRNSTARSGGGTSHAAATTEINKVLCKKTTELENDKLALERKNEEMEAELRVLRAMAANNLQEPPNLREGTAAGVTPPNQKDDSARSAAAHC